MHRIERLKHRITSCPIRYNAIVEIAIDKALIGTKVSHATYHRGGK